MGFNKNKHSTVWKEVKPLSHIQLFATSRTIDYQGFLNMGFSRQELSEWVVISISRDLSIKGLNLGLPHYRQTLFQYEPPGKASTMIGADKQKGTLDTTTLDTTVEISQE